LFNLWQDETQLIGVRFSTRKEGTTQYLMLDIDVGSQYHPCQDVEAFWKVISASINGLAPN
jgi:hypothetical protein